MPWICLRFVRYRFAGYRFVRCQFRFVRYRCIFLPSKYFVGLQDVFKVCLEEVFKTCLEDTLKTSSAKQFFVFKEVLTKCPEDIFKTSSRLGHQQMFPGKILLISDSVGKWLKKDQIGDWKYLWSIWIIYFTVVFYLTK